MNYISLERMISVIKSLTERKIFINDNHSALLDEADLKTDLYKDRLYKPVKDVDVYSYNVIISI